jgi:KaiC/GvpD/RAD55 family RecA-like ATPase
MADRYDFGNLSPIEFEGLCIDLLGSETGLLFERFSEGTDRGIDGRHSRADGDIILQAKHYKGSTWDDLQTAAKREAVKIAALNPTEYYFLTSQPLTPDRKDTLVGLLAHSSVTASRIRGRTELNGMLTDHPKVERNNIKLWLSSAAVLQHVLTHDITAQTTDYTADIDRILKIYVANPSLAASNRILDASHNLIISGPPGVGKTTLSKIIAADHIEAGYQLVAIGSIDDGHRARSLDNDTKQLFVFDDFLGKIRLDQARLAAQDNRIVGFMNMVRKNPNKRFVLTTRAYIWHGALTVSEALDDRRVKLSEIVLDLAHYTRELKARILYNHLYHADIDQRAVEALLDGATVAKIVDHPNYMPRVIEAMTEGIGQQGIAPEAYPGHFLANLDRPDEIWQKPFRQHISEAARILLYCAFFAEPIGWSDAAVSIAKLRPFFEKALICFGVVSAEGLRAVMFEDTLRELKSSFVAIDRDRLAFINPSVADFLSREAMDPNVVRAIAAAAPRWDTVIGVWNTVRETTPAGPVVARIVLDRCVVGGIEGSLPLHKLVEAIGPMVLLTGAHEICATMRGSGSDEVYSVTEAGLPVLIGDLLEGRYAGLPHARAFGRLMRRKLLAYLEEDRGYVLELEDLSEMAKNLSEADIAMPSGFVRAFNQAANESVDAYDLDTISRGTDPEQEIHERVEQMALIETYSSSAHVYLKRREFEERLEHFAWLEEQRAKQDERSGAAPAPTSSGGGGRLSPRLSDADLGAMFSSLRKRD